MHLVICACPGQAGVSRGQSLLFHEPVPRLPWWLEQRRSQPGKQALLMDGVWVGVLLVTAPGTTTVVVWQRTHAAAASCAVQPGAVVQGRMCRAEHAVRSSSAENY